MAQDWITQLQSDDPKVRAQAVKEIAFSGNQDDLKYLVEIVENDPEPQLREYAKKAAQHLYSSLKASQPAAPPTPSVEPADEIRQELTPRPVPAQIKPEPIKPEQTETEERAIPRADIQDAELKIQRAYSLHMGKRTKNALPVLAQALVLNPDLEKNPYARSVAAELTGKSPDVALHILKDPTRLRDFIEEVYGKAKKAAPEKSPRAQAAKPESGPVTRKDSSLIQTWLSFFSMDESFFDQEQERANTEDTLLSVLVYTIATVVISMVTGFVQFQQITALMGEQLPQLGFNLGTIFFIILIGTVILSPISFYLSTGLQYLGVRLFGGSGDFKTQAYLMALTLVPATVLGGVVSLLAFIPVIGFLAGLAGFGLSIFTIILTVRLIKSVHNVTTGRAIAGIIVPPVVLSAIAGCILMAVGSSLAQMLTQLQ